jgi:hypothetical protein
MNWIILAAALIAILFAGWSLAYDNEFERTESLRRFALRIDRKLEVIERTLRRTLWQQRRQ